MIVQIPSLTHRLVSRGSTCPSPSGTLLSAVVLVLVTGPASSRSSSIETTDTAVTISTASDSSSRLWKHDKQGFFQLGAPHTLTVGSTSLKHVVHEDADHSDNQSSFRNSSVRLAPPSFCGHATGGSMARRRILPRGSVGYSRVEAKQHHWWDVPASTRPIFGLQFGFSRAHSPTPICTDRLQ